MTLEMFYRWDAPHYINLAENWYNNAGDPKLIAFRPLYPLTIRLANSLFNNYMITGLVLPSLFFILGATVFYKLLRLNFPKLQSRWVIAFLTLFPTSYFWFMPYTESFYLLLLSSAFYFGQKKKWLRSGIFAGLAAFTRPFGLLIAPALIFEWLREKGRSIKGLVSILLPTAIFEGIFLFLNKFYQGDYFAFRFHLKDHWQKHLAWPWEGIIMSWKLAFNPSDQFYLITGWGEALPATLLWLLVPFAFIKLRRSWFVYYLLATLVTTSTWWLFSTPRYILSIPFLFVLLPMILRHWTIRTMWLAFSLSTAIFLALKFYSGAWAF